MQTKKFEQIDNEFKNYEKILFKEQIINLNNLKKLEQEIDFIYINENHNNIDLLKSEKSDLSSKIYYLRKDIKDLIEKIITIELEAPYNEELVKSCKKLGGQWHPARKKWQFRIDGKIKDLREKVADLQNMYTGDMVFIKITPKEKIVNKFFGYTISNNISDFIDEPFFKIAVPNNLLEHHGYKNNDYLIEVIEDTRINSKECVKEIIDLLSKEKKIYEYLYCKNPTEAEVFLNTFINKKVTLNLIDFDEIKVALQYVQEIKSLKNSKHEDENLFHIDLYEKKLKAYLSA